MKISEVKPGMYIVDNISDSECGDCINYIVHAGDASLGWDRKFEVICMYLDGQHNDIPQRLEVCVLFEDIRLATKEEIRQFEVYRKLYGL